MLETKLVSVIICTFNGNNSIHLPLNSLLNQTYPLEKIEIILVDDGSINPIEYNKMNYLDINIKIIRNEVNKGLGYSRNIAVKCAKGSFIFFTDDDCTLDKYWIETMVKSFDKFPDSDAFGGKILSSKNDNFWQFYTEHAKIQFFNHMTFQNNNAFNYISRFFSSKVRKLEDGQLLKSCMGLNSAYRSEILKQFPPDKSKKRGVDLDINLRILSNGSNIRYIETAKVYHPHRDKLTNFCSHAFAYGKNSNLTFRLLNKKIIPYPFPFLVPIILIFYLLCIFLLALNHTLSFVLISLLSAISVVSPLILYYVANIGYIIKIRKITDIKKFIFFFPLGHLIWEFCWDLGWISVLFLKKKNNLQETS
ncbi:glycosyltransferase family 2 protein [Candidatus Lokiarchaeum ossiferum]|uniref:glycosyltransferase family 2 protein n=1 Tax=Candidatus Lokiarchaeum ossiferum TaxID=2951803 RepID=UPI00352C8612